MNLHRLPAMIALLACVSGLIGCAHTSSANSDTIQPPSQRRPDSSQAPSYYGQSYQKQVDSNSRVGQNTK